MQCRFLRLLGKGKRGPAGTQNANSGSGMREPKAGVTISHAIHVPIHGSACWCAVCMGAVNSDGFHGYVLRGLVVYYCSDRIQMIVKRFALFVVNLLFYVESDSRHAEEAQCALQTEKRFCLAKSGLRVCVCVCVFVLCWIG